MPVFQWEVPMTKRIPSKWSYIIKYMGGHPNISEKCTAILRFTREKVEIESFGKGKIWIDYKDCMLELQTYFESKRIVLIYNHAFDTEGKIFIQIKNGKEEKVLKVFHIYQNLALGLEKELPIESYEIFKWFSK